MFQQRQVYNYPLPEEYYYQLHQRPFLESDTTPRSMCIDPQELFVASPPQSPSFDDNPFPTALNQMLPRSAMEQQYSVSNFNQVSRKQLAHMAAGQNPNVRYTSERNSSHRSTHQQQPQFFRPSTLPSPPNSPTSTIPAAPNNTPTYHINLPFHNSAPTPDSRSTVTPKVAYTQSTQERAACTHPDCVDQETGKSIKTFSRRADLQRHHSTTHADTPLFSCPRPNCHRKGDRGFSRMDHLVEHRRGYHHEKLPKRNERGSRSPKGRRVNGSANEALGNALDEMM